MTPVGGTRPLWTVGDRLWTVGERVSRVSIRRLRRHYWVAVGASVALGVLSMGRPFLRRHGFGPPLPHNDSVILEYVGWFVANGNTLYTDIWEIKPPLAFLPPYLFAHLTGTNMYAHHLLGIATTTAALALTAAFAARVVGTLTESPVAGGATGVVFFALPDLLYLPWLGYKAKIMVFAVGMAALDRAVHGRHFGSGALAGLAVGFWQLGVVFPLLTLVYAARTRSATAVRRQVAGGTVAVAVICTALLLYADVGGFVAEVVLGPLVLQSERGAFTPRTYVLFFPSRAGTWLTLIGAAGLASTLVDPDRRAARPLALGGALAALVVVFVDFDGLWDMVYPLVFVALGVGFLVGRLPRPAGVAAVVVLALVVVPTFAPSELVRQDPVEMEPSDGLPPTLDPQREYLYWTHQPARSCRVFGAGTQRSILEHYPDADTLAGVPCGNADLYWRLATRRLAGVVPPPLGGSTPPPSNVTATPEPT